VKGALAKWLPKHDAPEIEPALPDRARGAWDGSELRLEVIEKIDKGEWPAQNYNRSYDEVPE
jgi:hypothetical protein